MDPQNLTVNDLLKEFKKSQRLEQLALLMQSIPSKCYQKCITKPSKSLSAYDQVSIIELKVVRIVYYHVQMFILNHGMWCRRRFSLDLIRYVVSSDKIR